MFHGKEINVKLYEVIRKDIRVYKVLVEVEDEEDANDAIEAADQIGDGKWEAVSDENTTEYDAMEIE